MKSLRKKDGALAIVFEPNEAEFLVGLSGKIAKALEVPGNKRLFPSFSKDPKVDDELREMLHAELKSGRLERLALFQRELQTARRPDNAFVLDDAAAERWLGVLNDLRLILADELGIDADDWPTRLTKEQRAAPAVRTYLYLTGLQGHLLEQLMA